MEAPVQYVLNKQNVIVAVNSAWEAFAEANAGTDLSAEKVVGRRLFDYITGDVTRMFVETLLDSVRQVTRPLVRPYRCDSPQLRRYMEMELRPRAGGEVELSHRLLRTEALEQPIHFTVATAGRARPVKRCSMCGRLKRAAGWVEPAPPAGAAALPVIYSICPDCQARAARRPAAAF